MKKKKLELAVDYIGGQGSLTVKEEKALSDYLNQRRLVSKKSSEKPPLKTTKRHRVNARQMTIES